MVDATFMAAALSLAARTLGDTWPNPAVGCVIVKDGVRVLEHASFCVSTCTFVLVKQVN